MGDLLTAIERHRHLSDAQAKQAGQAIAGSMSEEHRNFVKTITVMLKDGVMDVARPETFLNREVYEQLPFAVRAKVDIAMVNIADLLRHIAEFYLSKKTPDESPQLQTMIEQLWQMKARIEERYGDVFVF